ncbi:MAG TPA: SET domain-containing protein, partial [Alphaproteobacteria bacterium]|nr:SET domain-containing protein [Alphaproteobacteria bacterium]
MPPTLRSKPYRIGRAKSGLGLFATETIKRGTRIIRYIGKKMTNAEADKLDTKYVFELNSRYSIDGQTRRNIARYINHSCKPNSTIDISRGRIFIKSIRRIEPGHEITYNYGPGYWDAFIKPK